MIEAAANAPSQVGSLLAGRFRCAEQTADFAVAENLSSRAGFFRFGPDAVCYGSCATASPAASARGPLPDLLPHAGAVSGEVRLPFDPVQVIDNLRHERYVGCDSAGKTANRMSSVVRAIYYLARPLMPVGFRKHLQRRYLSGWKNIPFPAWPVDSSVDALHERLLELAMRAGGKSRIPFIWFWPDGLPSAAAVTHDVESAEGLAFCAHLMDLDDSYGIKSSFQVVPEKRYEVPPETLEEMRRRGFEVDIHDLNHDGNLLSSREEFLRRAKEINRYGRQFQARGFRAGVLYRNIDWYRGLEFAYDMSVPNVGHLDPQRGGCCTVFPFFNGCLLELPVTMVQDYSLYNVLNEYSIDLWKQQIAIIRARHGMMKLIVHPDYNLGEKERGIYAQLLACLANLRDAGETWVALPAEINDWWRQRNEMRLAADGNSWRIEGPGSERARLAWAVLEDSKLRYEIEK